VVRVGALALDAGGTRQQSASHATAVASECSYAARGFCFAEVRADDGVLDWALPMAKAMCDGTEQQTGGKLCSTFVDLVPVFAGHADYFSEDIHPNDVGGKAMADKIWQVMTDKCLGQKAPKDCCES
jgi:hypothetical protein